MAVQGDFGVILDVAGEKYVFQSCKWEMLDIIKLLEFGLKLPRNTVQDANNAKSDDLRIDYK